jgi:hypothetical protein
MLVKKYWCLTFEYKKFSHILQVNGNLQNVLSGREWTGLEQKEDLRYVDHLENVRAIQVKGNGHLR